jgi:hypothetical protein
VTQSENIIHYNNQKKEVIKIILQIDKSGNLIKEWKNMKEITDNTDYKYGMLYGCLNGKYKFGYGHKWIYKDYKIDIITLNDDEIFKNVGIFENCDFSNYEASNYGKIKTLKYDKIMKLNDSGPYDTVMLYDKNTKKGERRVVHRLVAHVFVNGRTKKNEYVNHIDEKKRNNYYKNLEWTTKRTNTILALGKKVNQLDFRTNEILNTFDSIKYAFEFLGYEKNLGNITNCCKGTRKTAYGYKWEYAK